MYHPSRGGVRGGRDQFNWDDVKGDKHRENYLGHSVKAPVGRWQKGKDLTWYAKDRSANGLAAADAAKAEIQKIKDEEEQAMRELLGLAPKRDKRPQGNRLDKRETAELLKRGKAEEDLAPGYAQGERVEGLGFAPAPRHTISQGTSFHLKMGDTKIQDQLPGINLGEHANKEPNLSTDDDMDAKRRKKLEKREAKEKRREEKRAVKKAGKMEKRKYKEANSDSDVAKQRRRRRHDSSDSD